MGNKRTIHQRRGSGSNRYQANTHNAKDDIEHVQEEKSGTIMTLEHDPARTAPVAHVKFDDGTKEYILAPEGIQEGQEITIGRDAPLESGNTLPLSQIPEGVPIHNLELQPGDGGKIARSGGTYAFVITHERDVTKVYLPSKKIKDINPKCRATIGQVAGAGQRGAEFRKAGEKHHLAKARGQLYPNTSAVAMNATDHPFGGSANPGKPKTVSRHGSPGQTVGSVSASRTGRKRE